MKDTPLLYDFKNISNDVSVETNVLKSNSNYLDIESKVQIFNSIAWAYMAVSYGLFMILWNYKKNA